MISRFGTKSSKCIQYQAGLTRREHFRRILIVIDGVVKRLSHTVIHTVGQCCHVYWLAEKKKRINAYADSFRCSCLLPLNSPNSGN